MKQAVETDSQYVIVGQVGSTYGIKGWLKIISYTEVISNIVEYNPWYIEDLNGWNRVNVEESSPHGNGIIAKLAGWDSPEKAKLLSGKKIAVLRSQLPHLSHGEYYWSDLKGLTVINQHGTVLGKISYLIETGSNDVMVVKGEQEHAIPYLPGTVVQQVDLVKGEMHVNWETI